MKVNESTLLHDTCKKQMLEKLIDITSAIAFFFLHTRTISTFIRMPSFSGSVQFQLTIIKPFQAQLILKSKLCLYSN